MNIHTIILAGGKGTRMLSQKAKVLQALGGRTMLNHVITTANKIADKISVVVGFDKERVEEEIIEIGINANIYLQKEQIGTADAVKVALNDINENEKFEHKLRFLDEMATFFEFNENQLNVICGDFNVSPNEDDVWSHKQLQNIVSHTKVEREKLIKIMNKGKFIDTTRMFISPPKNVFTWWSYRSKDFKKNNRGRRLDHIWITDHHEVVSLNAKIIIDTRSLPQPSDHVPISYEFDLS